MRFGWIPDYPDARDYTKDTGEIKSVLDLNLKSDLPNCIDLRKYGSPIVDQGNLGSCTANAAAGIVEYFENRTFKTYPTVSRLFIYKATRNLMVQTGDTGAHIRTTMGSLAIDWWALVKAEWIDMKAFEA